MSPRKSSTSSGRPPKLRPRYLGIEAAGEPFLPRGWWEAALDRALHPTGPPNDRPRVHLVRIERGRVIVEVDHRAALEARRAWNGTLAGPAGVPVKVATHRTWGTLREAKRWLRAPSAGRAPVVSRRRDGR